MSKTKRGLCLLLSVVMMLSLLSGIPVPVLDLSSEANAVDSNTNKGGNSEWVTAWHTSMLYLDAQSDVDEAVSALSDYNERTFRTVIPMTIAGNYVRLTYSNEYAYNNEVLKIGEITLAKGNPSNAAQTQGTMVKCTDMAALFKTAIAEGKAEISDSYYEDGGILHVKPGQVVVSEPINISALGLQAMDYLAVSTWVCDMNSNFTGFKNGFTGGLIGGKTNYLGLAVGGGSYNHTEASDLDDVGWINSVPLSSSNATGEYNIIPFLNTVEVRRNSLTGVEDRSSAYTTVIFGDSTVANDIPVYIAQNLNSGDIDGVAVTWAAVKGNEVLLNGQDGSGDGNGNIMDEAAISVVNEVKNLSGVKKVIVKVGINDILHPQCSDLAANYAKRSDDEIAQQIIAGYKYIVNELHDKGIEVYFYELTPWRADDGTQYNRKGSVSWTEKVDNIRLKVNAWLAKYGDTYDNYVTMRGTATGDGYTGNITLGNQYGANGYTKAYETKTVTVSQSPFDRFGYISLEDLGSTEASYAKSSVSAFDTTFTGMTALKKGYTTDGIHFTAAGQSKVAKLTPTSIFYQRQDSYAGAGDEVNIEGIYFATTSLNNNHKYFICNTNAADVKNGGSSNQSTTGYLAGNKYYGTDKQSSTGSGSDLESNKVTVQRGTKGYPYIVSTGVDPRNEWTLIKDNGNNFWENGGKYLAWYYNGNSNSKYKTGIVNEKPYKTGAKYTWYTFDKISDINDFKVQLVYDSDILVFGQNKYLTFNNNTFQATKSSGYIALYDNSSNGVKVKLDINQDSNKLLDVSKDETVLIAANGKTTKLQFRLDSQQLGAQGNLTGNKFSDAPAGNEARGPYEQYTFGDNQKIFWMSTNTDVATIGQAAGTDNIASYTYGGGDVTFTGNGGTTALVANFFWREYDGEDYVFDNKVVNGTAEYYSTAEKDAAIADGTKVPDTGTTGYHWVEINNDMWVYTNYHWLTSTTVVTNINKYDCDILLGGLTNNTETEDSFLFNETPTGNYCTLTAVNASDPVDAELPGTAWKWVSSNESVARIASSADEYATVEYTGTGDTTITLTRIDAAGNAVNGVDGKPITSKITVRINEKPTIDIKLDGSTDNSFRLTDVTVGDEFSLEAYISNKSTATITSWKWTVINEKSEAIGAYTVSPNNADKAKLILNEAKPALVVVEAEYTLGGETGTVTSFIAVNAEYGIGFTASTVIDYGIPVKLDVKAAGISASAPEGVELVKGKSSDNKFDANDVALSFGKASLSGGVITYTPEKIATDKDKLYYSAEVKGGYKYSDIDIIPATSVYYEDSIGSVTYTNGTNAAGKTAGTWTVAGNGISADVAQDLSDGVYGYDKAYDNSKTYSMGSAHTVTVDKNNNPNGKYTENGKPGAWPTASFSFTGTGFDVISLTSNKCGVIRVNVTGDDYNKSFVVDSYRGYDLVQNEALPYIKYVWEYSANGWHIKHIENADNDKNGKFVADKSLAAGESTTVPENPKAGDTLVTFENNVTWTPTEGDNANYQIPVMKVTDLPYGSYTVTVTAMYSAAFDHAKNGSCEFTLDAIRIYGAMENAGMQEYVDAKEAYPQYINLRNVLITASKDISDTLKGVAIIDGKSDNVSIEEYKDYGANNEIYLNPGKALTFSVSGDAPAAIKLGMKALGDSASVSVNGKNFEIATKTDMYYDISDAGSSITVTNVGSEPVSLTTLKLTFAEAGKSAELTVTAAQLEQAKLTAKAAILACIEVEPEPEPTVEPEPTPFAPVVSIDAPEKATVGEKVTVKIKTGSDVAYITVNGEKITDHDSDYVWSYTFTAEEKGSAAIEVVAYNADGEAADTVYTASVQVSEPEPEPVKQPIIKKIFTAIKNFFGRLFGRK